MSGKGAIILIMKITNQTTDTLVVKIPSMDVFIGTIFLLVGIALSIFSVAVKLPIAFFLAFFFILGGVGLGMVLLGSSYFITFNKQGGIILYLKKNFIKQDLKTYSFQDTDHIETNTTLSMSSTPNKVQVVQSFVVMKDGTRLMLDYQHGPKNRVMQKETEAALSVADFIGVNYIGDRKYLSEDEFDQIKM